MMKKFLLRLVTFLSLVVVTYAAFVASAIVLNRGSLGSCRLAPGTDSVVLGDSHTAWAIDDTGIEGLQNVSLNAEGYRYTYAKLAHLLHTEPGIKRVYLGFSYHNLSGYYDEYIVGSEFKFLIERYLSVLTLADYVELVRNNPLDVPEYFKRTVQLGLPAGLKGRCTLYGHFSDVHMTEEFDSASMEKRIVDQYYKDGRLRAPSTLNLEYLAKIVELSRESGVELVMLNTPLHPEYEKRVPQEYRERYNRFLEQNGLRSYDFRDLRLTDADFLPDGDHTNYNGAILTSRRFAAYHRSLKAGQ